MIKHTRWMAVVVVMVFLCGGVTAQQVQMIESHLGNEGPAFQEGMTPSTLGWGADDQAYPDRFVVYPDGSELVWVPAGEFMMGSADDDEDAWDHEKPAHRVRITRGFWMQKHEVTNAQYRAFCEVTGRKFPEKSDKGDDHPVVGVTWDDAVAYAEHYELSLPTEAQWEYAARGPEGHIYPWGDEWDPEKLCWGENLGPGQITFPMGSFPQGASWVGALNMAGNVWEWCADWYDPRYYARSPVDDPRGPSEGRQVTLRAGDLVRLTWVSRVVRGGGWYFDVAPRDFRAACRYDLDPSNRHYGTGFRCVRGL